MDLICPKIMDEEIQNTLFKLKNDENAQKIHKK